ncbi:DUF3343 domain-containing protein [Clostridium sporogenes]|jgi:hypothetical protein|nr:MULTISPECIES: DUF3343 domain-containing protein [Clostridium]AJD31949.1 hypothetical protein T258_2301 [Clostridium botulinum Prevot_594]STC85068.1 Protein of uncharacterised function (DUF3343) [Clostridium botulinum]AKC64251.1 hypothetical protein DUF3343 [Clostridium sporogenes]AKJ91372.1 hypothetical protein CLSPOx_17820 [Clostridium sporogenes]EHN14198.1 hypothetical protein IYC_15058 [Clostridium sporogenes PA 3679]
MEYIASFFTHSGAIKYSRFLNKLNINNQTMPVPRKLSSNCGIGVKFNYKGNLNNILAEDIEKLFSVKNGQYECIYCAE